MKNLEIFRPLIEARNQPVFISTWGLGDYFDMREVVEPLRRNCQVEIMVGYSKKSHDLPDLLSRIKLYASYKWRIRLVPGMHIKAWVIGKYAYVGSCNFVPNDPIINEMWKVPASQVTPILSHYWQRAAQFSHSTVLELVHPVRERHDERREEAREMFPVCESREDD